MDLRTSRKPPAVPRVVGEPTTTREAELMAHLDAPMLPLELVRRLAWPRLEVYTLVRSLAHSRRLDTPRASFGRGNLPTAARPAAGPRRSGPERASDTANSGTFSWAGLPLSELGERVAQEQNRRLALAQNPAEVIDALSEPLWAELDPLWKGFVESERFATRVAFGLPDEPELGQSERFASDLMALFAALPRAAQVRLEALVEGRVSSWSSGSPGSRVLGAVVSGGDLADLTAKQALAVLFDDGERAEVNEVLARLGPRTVLAIFVGNHVALTGRGGPRPTPRWIAELDELAR